jgi:hypothetical protein
MTEPTPRATPPTDPMATSEPSAPGVRPPPASVPPGPSESTAGATGPSASAAMSGAQTQAATLLARLGLAEQLAVGGAVLILLGEVVTGLIFDEYYSGDLVSLLAVAVLVAAWIRHMRSGEVPLGYVTVIRIAGFAVGLIAITDLFVEVRHGAFGNGIDIVGAIGYYVGAALMVGGAIQIKEH